jgi:hypothetical protein
VDFSRVQDDTDPQLPFWLAVTRKAGVVFGEEPVEEGDRAVQQERLGHLVHRMNEGQDAITAVDEPVVPTLADARRAQRPLEQLVGLIPELSLNGIGAAGRTLDVQRDDRTVMRQASRQERSHQNPPDAATTVRSCRSPAGRR